MGQRGIVLGSLSCCNLHISKPRRILLRRFGQFFKTTVHANDASLCGCFSACPLDASVLAPRRVFQRAATCREILATVARGAFSHSQNAP